MGTPDDTTTAGAAEGCDDLGESFAVEDGHMRYGGFQTFVQA